MGHFEKGRTDAAPGCACGYVVLCDSGERYLFAHGGFATPRGR
jgi:hypothetical protein